MLLQRVMRIVHKPATDGLVSDRFHVRRPWPVCPSLPSAPEALEPQPSGDTTHGDIRNHLAIPHQKIWFVENPCRQ